MKKCLYFLSVIAISMLAVSCDDIEGDNPNEDIPEIIDPFLGDVVPNDYTTNQENFSNLTNILLNSCYHRRGWYGKQSDNTWQYTDCMEFIGLNGLDYVLLDSTTLLEYTYNASLGPKDEPKFNKYTVAYDAETGTIYTTEILQDGTNGETNSGKLLAVTPKPVIEGKFCSLDLTPNKNLDARWCFEERADLRNRLFEEYESWLSKQE